MSTVIKVNNLGKTFKLPHEKQTSIKGAFIGLFRGGKRTYETQQALKNISFEVKKGEFFGIVGRNGSGKSTLLKILAQIYEPSEGSIEINGSLTPFIELGVGFNHELTGRENVYLNGALLGFSRKEVAKMYGEIVSFAELEKFMDQKLKNYSSGMQVRLAFSIAMKAHQDILIVDEVLAVGDERFQQKCLNIFDSIKKDKTKTVIFVSHDMQSVQRFCDRAMLIHDSRAMFIGDTNRAAIEYKKLNFPDMVQELETSTDTLNEENHPQKSSNLKITKFDVIDYEGHRDRIVSSGKPFTLEFHYEAKQNFNNLTFGVGLKNKQKESIYGPNTKESNQQVDIKIGKGTITLKVENNVFSPGSYTLDAGFFNNNQTTCYDYISVKDAVVFVGVERHGYAYVEPKWTIK